MKHPLSTLLWFNMWFCKQSQTHIQYIVLGKKQSYLYYVTTLSDSSGATGSADSESADCQRQGTPVALFTFIDDTT